MFKIGDLVIFKKQDSTKRYKLGGYILQIDKKAVVLFRGNGTSSAYKLSSVRHLKPDDISHTGIYVF